LEKGLRRGGAPDGKREEGLRPRMWAHGGEKDNAAVFREVVGRYIRVSLGRDNFWPTKEGRSKKRSKRYMEVYAVGAASHSEESTPEGQFEGKSNIVQKWCVGGERSQSEKGIVGSLQHGKKGNYGDESARINKRGKP